ncbi:MAG: DNA ligase [Thalassotalea sp.]|nr:DNA ligase [Thalassotalea sp.]
MTSKINSFVTAICFSYFLSFGIMAQESSPISSNSSIQLSSHPSNQHSKQPPIQKGVVMDEAINVKDYWVSEKLDGIRGYWNGEKLLTRSGNEIKAPSWFTKGWPKTFLDGEIWSERNAFESINSCVSQQKENNNCWQNLQLMIFDLPSHKGRFSQRIIAMQTLINGNYSPYLQMIEQVKIESKSDLYKKLEQVIKIKGEGLMLHHNDAFYKQGRNKHLMKLKKYQDAEAVVIKHLKGKGKYRKMLGSVLVETPSGLQFKIGTGFSDQQRKNPPPIGSIITYQYIGKTKRGVPRFASFKRIRKLN